LNYGIDEDKGGEKARVHICQIDAVFISVFEDIGGTSRRLGWGSHR
jgi:hypothetical protein